VTYDIPQGERRSIDVDLTDATYDGIIDGQRLSGGLGQLTDGELGQSNFRAVDRRGTGVKASNVALNWLLVHVYTVLNKCITLFINSAKSLVY